MLSSFRSIFFSFASYLLQAACGTTREFRRLYRLLLCSPDRRYPALVGSFLCSFYFSDDHTRDIFYRLPGLHYYKDAFGLALCRNSGACRIFRTMCEKKKRKCGDGVGGEGIVRLGMAVLTLFLRLFLGGFAVQLRRRTLARRDVSATSCATGTPSGSLPRAV